MAERLPVVHERGVRRALKLLLGGGAPLIVCVCASSSLRARVEEELAERLAPKGVRVAELGDDPWRDVGEGEDRVLSLGTRGVTDTQWQALNVGREIRVRRALSMLLWVDGLTEYAKLPERAPDLWSHRADEVFFLSHEDFAADAPALEPETAQGPDVELKAIEETLRNPALDPVARLYALHQKIGRLRETERVREFLATNDEAMERFEALRFSGTSISEELWLMAEGWRAARALWTLRTEEVFRIMATPTGRQASPMTTYLRGSFVVAALGQRMDYAASAALARQGIELLDQNAPVRGATAYGDSWNALAVAEAMHQLGRLKRARDMLPVTRRRVQRTRAERPQRWMTPSVQRLSLLEAHIELERADTRAGLSGLISLIRDHDGLRSEDAEAMVAEVYLELGMLEDAERIAAASATPSRLDPDRERSVAIHSPWLRAALVRDPSGAEAHCDELVEALRRKLKRAPVQELKTLARLEIASVLALFEGESRSAQALDELDRAVRESDAMQSIDHSAMARDQRAALFARRARHVDAATDLHWLIEHCVTRWGAPKRAGWLIRLGEAKHAMGDLTLARATFEQARAERDRDPPEDRSIITLKDLALARHRTELALGDSRVARALLDEALAAAREEEHRGMEIALLHARAELDPAAPEDDPREDDARRALEIARKALWIRDEARAMANLAACHIRRGRLGPARALLDEARWIAQELNDKNVLPRVEAVMALLPA